MRSRRRHLSSTLIAHAGILAVLLLAGPACTTANSECSKEEGWCGGNSKCCEGLTCHPYVTTCYSKQRKNKQPCIPGKADYDCGAGLSCDPVSLRCYDDPREEDQPCDPSPGATPCGPGLACYQDVRRCFKVGLRNEHCTANPDTCDTTGARGEGKFSCHPGRFECFAVPRGDDDPCTDENGNPTEAFACAEGYACEVGVTNECQKMGTKTWERCHETRPCGPGFSCQLSMKQCFHNPREVGEPCADTDDQRCGPGLYCDIRETGECVRAQKEGEHCYTVAGNPRVGKPCKKGMKCDNTDMKCYRWPLRREGDPCKSKCEEGYVCHPLYKTCVEIQSDEWSLCFGDPACEQTPNYKLTCAPGVQMCFLSPRKSGYPCDANNPCGPGLKPCDPAWPYCQDADE